MKKKIIAFIITIVMALNLTACNWTFFDTEYTFNAAITTFNGKTYFYHIVKWKDYEGEQLQITLEDGSVIVVSSFNTILIHWNDNGTSTVYNNIKAAEE